MGSLFSSGAQGRTDDPDPVTGLTSRERYLVKKTWGVIRQTPTESGTAFLKVFFTNYPHHKQLFPFRNVPDDQLYTNKRFLAHANAVIYGFSAIVDAVDDADMLSTILDRIGESHVPRGIDAQSFHDLKLSLLEVLSAFKNQEEMEAWTKTLDVATEVMVNAFNEHSKK